MKKFFATFLCLVLCGGLLPAQAAGPEVNAKAVLLMEKTTGQVLYEEHAHDPLELASVTKVMTMLLIMEALEEGTITKETMVPVSATAAGMGGSQVYMKEGESFSVHDMLKAIAVASGNDACVAMAEYLAGSESAFAEKMNETAHALGATDTPPSTVSPPPRKKTGWSSSPWCWAPPPLRTDLKPPRRCSTTASRDIPWSQ